MAETTGKVDFVTVNATHKPGLRAPKSDFAVFQLSGVRAGEIPIPFTEIYFVWFALYEQNMPTGPQWMQRALQVSLLRDALLANKTVTVSHDDTSAFVITLQINA